jgi:hypothetical protein
MADAGTLSASHTSAPLVRRRLVPPQVWAVGHILVLVEVVFATRRFTFFQDDYVFVAQGRGEIVRDGVIHSQPLTLDYLRDALFEHFSPLARLGFWVIGRTDAPQMWARLVVLALVAGLVVALGILCRVVLGRTLEALLLTMIAGQGLVVVHLAGWTTASLNMVPAVALCSLSFAAAVRYLRDERSSWYAVVSVVLFGFGLLDYELTMFLPVFIGSWFLLCVGPELGFRTTLARIVQSFFYWLAFAVLAAAAALNFKLNYMASGLSKPSAQQFIETLWHSLAQGLFPSVLGVSAVEHGAGIGAVVAMLVWAWLVIVGLIQLGPRFAASIALAFIGWFLCTATLAWGRAAVNTPWVGIDLFYAAVPLLVLVVAVAEALRLPVRVRRRRAEPQLRVVSVLAAVALVSAGLTQAQSRQATDPNGVASAARAFQRTFLRAVSEHGAPAVVSAPVPDIVVLRSFYPYDYISRNVGTLTHNVRWDVADGGPLYRTNAYGELVEVTVAPRARANIARIRESGTERSADGRCHLMRDSTSQITVPFPEPVSGPNLIVHIEGTIDRSSASRPFVVLTDGQRWGATGSLTRWKRGDIHAAMLLTADAITRFGLTGFVPGTRLCLDSVVVGSLVDVPGQ